MSHPMGNRYYPLSKTYYGKWLALIRIQSVQLSLLIVIAGYIATGGSVINNIQHMIPLLVATALGHFGVYAHNDIVDVDVDMGSKGYDKPLVSGDITMTAAKTGALILVMGAYIISFFSFPTESFLLFFLASIIGIGYNYVSKDAWWSSILMGFWGFMMVVVGSFYHSTITIESLLIGLAIGIAMTTMTIFGGIKDINADEVNFAKRLGCKLTTRRPKLVDTTKKFRGAMKIMDLAYSSFLIGVLYNTMGFNGELLIPLGVFGIALVPFLDSGKRLSMIRVYDDESIKSDLVMYVSSGAVMLLAALSSLSGLPEVLIICASAILWGISWQKIQYGNALYFP